MGISCSPITGIPLCGPKLTNFLMYLMIYKSGRSADFWEKVMACVLRGQLHGFHDKQNIMLTISVAFYAVLFPLFIAFSPFGDPRMIPVLTAVSIILSS